MMKAQASLTKTGILFTVIIFYAFIIYFIGLYYADGGSCSYAQESKDFSTTTGIFGTIIVSFVCLGWLNAILFTPLVLILTWIIVSSLPTFNGGG